MNQVLEVKGTPYRLPSRVTELAISSLTFSRIWASYFPPNRATACESVSVVILSFA